MLRIVFENPDRKPKQGLAQKYSEVISSGISNMKCPLHKEAAEFELHFNPPNSYSIEVSTCCQEFKSTVEKRIDLMLS